jgi:hypothetical protein
MGKDKKDRALYDAVKRGDASAVARLLEQGANPDAPVGKRGMTSMERAAGLKTRDIEKLLLARGGTLHKASTLRKNLGLCFYSLSSRRRH